MLQNMLAQTPLVRNLQNPEYMNILLDGKTTIEDVFAEIEITRLRQECKKAQQNPEKIPAKIQPNCANRNFLNISLASSNSSC